MTTFLVCKRCNIKEWLQPHTPIEGCAKCGAPRYAEDENGRPMLLWSAINDPTKWDVS